MKYFTLQQLANDMNLTESEAMFAIIKYNFHWIFTEKGIRVLKISKQELQEKKDAYLIALGAAENYN